MSFIDLNKTVSEIVEENPGFLQVLERFHVDYGFARGLTLTEVCLKQGIDLQDLLAQLKDSDQEEAFLDDAILMDMEIPELIENILFSHHGYLEKELPRLEDMFKQALHTYGEMHPNLLELLTYFKRFRESMEQHMKKQGKQLFPFFLVRTIPSQAEVEARILEFEQEDQKVRENLAQLRKKTEGFEAPVDAGRYYRNIIYDLQRLESETRRHLRVESDILFPKVLEAAKKTQDRRAV